MEFSSLFESTDTFDPALVKASKIVNNYRRKNPNYEVFKK